MGNIPVGKFPISLSAAVAVDCGRRLLRRIYRLAKPYSFALLLFKAGANTTLCFFRHWFQTAVFFTRKNFQDDSGLCTWSLSGFWSWPRLRVVGSCIRSVVAILPVGSITPVGIRNFYIPGNPGSPDWPSALRLFASSGFGSVNSSVARFAFPAVGRASAIVGISLSIALRFLSATSLHSEYHRELTDARVATFLLTRFCNLIFSSFRFPTCFVADSHFQSLSLNTLRCACSSIPYGQSVQGASCPLTHSCIPAFKSASANYSCEL
jgi:hypothetical protein